MLKRVVYFSSPAYLSVKLGQLVVELKHPSDLPKIQMPKAIRYGKSEVAEEKIVEYQLNMEDLGMIVLDHAQITLTQSILKKCAEYNILLLSCDDKHNPSLMGMSMEGHTLQSKRHRSQILANVPMKKQLWASTVQNKIVNQAIIGSNDKVLYDRLIFLSKSVKSGDSSNVEGQAAAIYWDRIFTHLDKHFVRGRYDDAINSFLNYGYAILRATMAKAVVASGLIPSLGIHHHNQYNAFCLVDDLMEPYRPMVDRLVLDLLDQGSMELDTEAKRQLLNIPYIDTDFDDIKSPLMVAVHRTAQSFVNCLEKKSKKILYPKPCLND